MTLFLLFSSTTDHNSEKKVEHDIIKYVFIYFFVKMNYCYTVKTQHQQDFNSLPQLKPGRTQHHLHLGWYQKPPTRTSSYKDRQNQKLL